MKWNRLEDLISYLYIMQLFITPYIKQDNTVVVTEERVVHQLKNVLRVKLNSEFRIQSSEWNKIIRFTVSISEISKDKVVWNIIHKEEINFVENNKYLLVALPNKLEKMELIVQKCTEIWLQHIIFFPSQYSQLREVSDNKLERLSKIALEAVEQSYGVVVPEIIFINDIISYLQQWKNILLHQEGKNIKEIYLNSELWTLNFFIWPEWWRWSDDEKIFQQYDIQKISLWKNILRTETAAIVMAREAMK